MGIDRALIFDVNEVIGDRRGEQSHRESWCWESAFNQVCARVLVSMLGMKPQGMRKAIFDNADYRYRRLEDEGYMDDLLGYWGQYDGSFDFLHLSFYCNHNGCH